MEPPPLGLVVPVERSLAPEEERSWPDMLPQDAVARPRRPAVTAALIAFTIWMLLSGLKLPLAGSKQARCRPLVLARGFVHDLAADHSHHRLDVLDLVGGHFQVVAI